MDLIFVKEEKTVLYSSRVSSGFKVFVRHYIFASVNKCKQTV